MRNTGGYGDKARETRYESFRKRAPGGKYAKKTNEEANQQRIMLGSWYQCEEGHKWQLTKELVPEQGSPLRCPVDGSTNVRLVVL